MNKFSGIVGFVKLVETEPSTWEEETTEKPYKGDYVRQSRRYDTATQANDNLTLSNEVSIVADSYMLDNYAYMKYVIIRGIKWKINYIEDLRPRMRLTLGGVYNVEPDTDQG